MARGAAALLIVAGIVALLWTPLGQRVRQDPLRAAADFRAVVQAHGWAGPAVFVGAYVLAAVFLLPVTWLPVLAGLAFGLGWGFAWSLAGQTAGALAGFWVARWVGGDWARRRFAGAHARLRRMEERASRHGLAFVLALRLSMVIPYGALNYLLGLTRVRARDVALGTALGNAPMLAVYVALGAGADTWKDWRFAAAVAAALALAALPVWRRYRAGRGARETAASDRAAATGAAQRPAGPPGNNGSVTAAPGAPAHAPAAPRHEAS